MGVRGGARLPPPACRLAARPDRHRTVAHSQREIASRRAELDVLPAGRHGGDASELLITPALPSLIEALHNSDYAYVLIDSPPILGVADGQMFAQFCDELLV